MREPPSRDARFRDLFDAHRDAIRAYCFRRLRPEDANDAVAEVFVVAWRKLDHAPEGDAARLWLYGVARNVVRNARRSDDRFRRLSVRLASVNERSESDLSTQMIRTEEERRLLDAVARLRPVDRELLRLRMWEELSSSEISVATGLSIRAVETRLSRIRKRLAGQLGDRPPHSSDVAARPVREGGSRDGRSSQ